jgi:cyclic beta-1,2-glucan synthetase
MYLLGAVTARDFGWIGTVEMVERLEQTLTTVDKLERFRGHLYNWYDTRDMRTLEPPYVSSVDSGNLAGHLLTVANACRQMIDDALPIATAAAGISDCIQLTRQATAAMGDNRRGQTVGLRHLVEALDQAPDTTHVPSNADDWAKHLEVLAEFAHTLSDVAETITAQHGDAGESELATWAEAVRNAVASHQRDFASLPTGGAGA